jgi:hypothetical protein
MQWQLESFPAQERSARVGLWISIGLALLVALLLLQLRRDGQDWGGDFSLYISHARNLSEGRPFSATGYIVDPYFRSHSPATYPPLFPLVLAPLYGKYGLNFRMLQIPGILCFAATIPLLFSLFRKDLPVTQSLLGVTLWAGWPFILTFKDSVLPDLLFTMLWALTIWMLRTACDQQPERRYPLRAILIGISAYAAYATRSAGVVLPFAILAWEFLRHRRITRFAVFSVGTFGLLAAGQNLLIHSETSYLQMFTVDAAKTLRIYFYSLSALFSGASTGWLHGVRDAAALLALLLAFAGFLAHLRRFRSPQEIAVAGYVILLLLWSPGAGTRYMVPVMPFFFFYLVTAFDLFLRNIKSGWTLEVAVLALILVCYASEYSGFQTGPIEGGVSTPGFAELCRFITANTSPGDVFIFQNPRVLSLYTQRPASVYPEHGDPNLVWTYSQSIHAHYLVVTDFLEGDGAILKPFLRDYGTRLRVVFSNAGFRLYSFES